MESDDDDIVDLTGGLVPVQSLSNNDMPMQTEKASQALCQTAALTEEAALRPSAVGTFSIQKPDGIRCQVSKYHHDTIGDLKRRISALSPDGIRLMFRGRELKPDKKSVASFGVTEKDLIQVFKGMAKAQPKAAQQSTVIDLASTQPSDPCSSLGAGNQATRSVLRPVARSSEAQTPLTASQPASEGSISNNASTSAPGTQRARADASLCVPPTQGYPAVVSSQAMGSRSLPMASQAKSAATSLTGSLEGTNSAKKKRKVSAAKAKAKAGASARSDEEIGMAHPKVVPEKRAKRFIPKPSIKVSERIARALTQRLYLVNVNAYHEPHYKCSFAVLGSTGNIYTVTLSSVVTCSCPDAGKGNLCKHVLFVMLRVLRLSRDNPIVWQKALLQSELQLLLARVADIQRNTGAVLANNAVREAFGRLTGEASGETQKENRASIEGAVGETGESGGTRKPIEEDDECPVCFEPLANARNEALVYCRNSCGKSIHKDCFTHWARQKIQVREAVTCVYCRAPWSDEGAAIAGSTGGNTSQNASSQVSGGTVSWEGYVNLGSLQGQSAVRDTSTYHDTSYNRRRKRSYGRYSYNDESY